MSAWFTMLDFFDIPDRNGAVGGNGDFDFPFGGSDCEVFFAGKVLIDRLSCSAADWLKKNSCGGKVNGNSMR